MSTDSKQDLERLLEYLKRTRGFDFTGYKRASLERRIARRMETVGVADYSDYIDFLEVHADEFVALFNTILINVTGFFRDDTAWSYLAEEVLPDLLARRPDGTIRVWCAGCATGEESYTTAMVLCELLGPEVFRTRVKIYATDVDLEALATARAALYGEREVASVPDALRERYFDRQEGGYVFQKELRRQVIFGRHDLIQDAPISRVDLLICRNTLMYFNAETQGRILARFHFSLTDGGILFLGRAETMLTHATTFAPIDLKRRISTKVVRGELTLRDRLLLLSQNGVEDPTGVMPHDARLREAAFDATLIAQVSVDQNGILALTNERARALFGLSTDDIGRPLHDLKLSYRPVELRSLIDQVAAERRPVIVRDVEWVSNSGEKRWLELQIIPLFEPTGRSLGASISFNDVTPSRRLQLELERANLELEVASEELQSTNEELETTNEELQSTVEELETTNEELQSTNEELETMNEELQSTNEELSGINDEVRERSVQLNDVNAFLESIFASLRGGVVALDADFQVLAWNDRATDLWGLRASEVVGKHFLGLDIGLPLEVVKPALKACVTGDGEPVEVEADAVNRRGRPIRCRVSCTPLLDGSGQTRGAIVLMDEVGRASAMAG